jgi:hypothetical protein
MTGSRGADGEAISGSCMLKINIAVVLRDSSKTLTVLQVARFRSGFAPLPAALARFLAQLLIETVFKHSVLD